MKTTILKYDYYVQLALVVVSVVSTIAFWSVPVVIAGIQFVIGFYLLCSSFAHILMEHKSIGFFQWRVRHFFGSLAYLILLIAMAFGGLINGVTCIWMVVVVPQIVLVAYTVLCKKELEFIEEREFHILK